MSKSTTPRSELGRKTVGVDTPASSTIGEVRIRADDAPPLSEERPVKRIVVVDDDEALGPAIRELLAPEGLAVEFPGDGQAALPSLLLRAPDLVILDVNMPGMSGWELCAILRRQSATRSIPILFLTGRHEVRDRIMAMQFGGSDYLAKPFTGEDLRRKVRTLLLPERPSEAG